MTITIPSAVLWLTVGAIFGAAATIGAFVLIYRASKRRGNRVGS